ncbi:MAG: hypothetical protein ACQGVK_03965 [Myxococcota bacterium]
MTLERNQIERLLSDVSRTCEEEPDCGDCLAGLAEFAELQLVGAGIPEALQRIQQHLEMCPECAEEYQVLLEIVRAAAAVPLR